MAHFLYDMRLIENIIIIIVIILKRSHKPDADLIGIYKVVAAYLLIVLCGRSQALGILYSTKKVNETSLEQTLRMRSLVVPQV